VWFDYSVLVEVFDRAGNVQGFVIPTLLRSAPFGPGPPDEVVVGDLFWTGFDDRDPAEVAARAEVRVDFKRGGPPAVPKEGDLVVARILVDGAVSDTFVPDDARTFRADRIRAVSPGIETVMEVSGPFLVAELTNDLGITTFAFRQPGLARGEEVTLNLEAIFAVAPADRPQLAANLAAVSACIGQGGPYDADCDGDGADDCCGLDVPVFFAGRGFAHWSLSDTRDVHRALRERVDAQRPTRQPAPRRWP
jgi:hypothetical protein